MLDLAITNGKVFIPGSGFFELNVGVKDGKIASLTAPDEPLEAKKTVDAGGKYVTPGFIDPHIHLGIFGDFAMECENETRAALAGGVTTVGVFMGGAESYLPTLPGMIDVVNAKASTDLFFHLSIFTPEQLAEIDEYVKQFGITSFKFYMAGVRGVFPGVQDGFVLEGFRKVASLGDRAIAAIHCEDQSMLDVAFEKLAAAKPNGTLADWTEAHPEVAEEEAVMRAVFMAEKAGNRLYCVHISSKLGVERFARIAGANHGRIFGETTSAYLSVNKHDPVGLMAKMLPPLRDQEDIEALWTRVADGTISSLGTDNVSMTKAVKGAENGMLGAMPGYPILQTHMPCMLTEGYHKRGVPLEAILYKATAGPAKIFGLYPQKGTIAVGSDADLVVLDVDKEWKVDSAKLFSYGDFSIHEGRTMKGCPAAVVKSGELAYQDGQMLIKPGAGSCLRRSL